MSGFWSEPSFSSILRVCEQQRLWRAGSIQNGCKHLTNTILNCPRRVERTSLGISKYRKFPKYSDTQKICCHHPKIWTNWLCHRVMSPNDVDGMANSVDPDQTAPRSSLIWVCTVCPGISVRNLRIITVGVPKECFKKKEKKSRSPVLPCKFDKFSGKKKGVPASK